MIKIDKLQQDNSNWYIRVVNLLIAIGIGNLIFYNTSLVVSILYGLIILLCLLLHIVIIKNFNIKLYVNNDIKTIVTQKKQKFLKLLIKVTVTQSTIWLLATWLLISILSQENFRSNKIANVTNNINLSMDLMLTSNLISWIVFISLLISFGCYRYYFKYSDVRLRLAKCLVNQINQRQTLTLLYNSIFNLEAYVRFIILSTCSAVVTMMFFNSMSHRFKFLDFLPYSSIISSIILVMSNYFKKYSDQMVDFFGKKTSMNVFSIYLIISFIGVLIIFTCNQLILSKVGLFKLIHFKSINLNTIKSFITPEKIIILVLAINIILMVSVSDLLLKIIRGYKLWMVYIASLIGAVVQGSVCYFLMQNNFLYNFLNKDWVGLLMLLIVLVTLRFNFRNIFCKIDLPINLGETNPNNIKEGFLLVVKKIIHINWLYLASYYMFSWIIPMYLFGLGIILLLPCIVMLYIKILYKIFNEKNVAIEVKV